MGPIKRSNVCVQISSALVFAAVVLIGVDAYLLMPNMLRMDTTFVTFFFVH